ncbi:MAG: histidine phosphatase family protein [Acholeplasmataceae bacterium]|jgi:broad specificity phosphatase PhoE
MKLIMVRHGQTDLNKNGLIQGRSDFPLNSKGIKDSLKAAEVLIDNIKKIDVFISSPSKRAYQTTQIILDKYQYNKTIIKDPNFYERNFGPYEGKVVKEVFPIIKFLPGYETNYEIQQRVYRGVMDLYQKYLGNTVLVGAHSHTIKALLTVYEPKSYNYHSVLLNGSIFIFDVKEDTIKLTKVLNNTVVPEFYNR